MFDPSTIAGYSLMGAGSGLVSRLMQHLFPTPLETAQTDNVYANLALARKRLEREEERVRADWDVRRELQLKQIEATQTIEQDRELMRRWPLELSAPAFVRYSQRQAGAALNLVLWPEQRRTPHLEAASSNGLLLNFHMAADALLDLIPRAFDHDIIYYRETEKPHGSARATLNGQQLEAAIFSLAATEPTALVQVAIDGPQALRLSYSCWGWSGDAQGPMSGSVIAEAPEPMSVEDVSTAILAVACALSDQYQLVRTLVRPGPPRLFDILSRDTALTFRDDRLRSPSRSLEEMLVGSYRSALDTVGAAQPELAAEAAARAALVANGAGQTELAQGFLDSALGYYRSAHPASLRDPGTAIARLLRPAPSEPQPLIRTALRDVGRLDPNDHREVNANMTLEEVLAVIGEYDQELDPEAREKIRAKVTEMLTYVPRIGIFGKAGVGKSSLCNALFGKDAFEVSDVEACTRAPQSLLLSLGKEKELTVVDVPGIGESLLRDEEYGELYKSLLPELDALIWVLKADERAFSVDQEFYFDTVKPHIEKGKPFLIALNQVDKIAPHKEWRDKECEPGPTQAENIERKRENVASIFRLDPKQVIAVSAEEKYGLRQLLDKMLLSLPDVKRPATFMAIPQEHRTQAAAEAVRESIESEISGVAVGVGALAGAAVGTAIFPVVGTIIGAMWGAMAGSFWRK